ASAAASPVDVDGAADASSVEAAAGPLAPSPDAPHPASEESTTMIRPVIRAACVFMVCLAGLVYLGAPCANRALPAPFGQPRPGIGPALALLGWVREFDRNLRRVRHPWRRYVRRHGCRTSSRPG